METVLNVDPSWRDEPLAHVTRLTPAVSKMLARLAIHTCGELYDTGDDKLLDQRGIGEGTLRRLYDDVADGLRRMGYTQFGAIPVEPVARSYTADDLKRALDEQREELRQEHEAEGRCFEGGVVKTYKLKLDEAVSKHKAQLAELEQRHVDEINRMAGKIGPAPADNPQRLFMEEWVLRRAGTATGELSGKQAAYEALRAWQMIEEYTA